MSETRQGQLTEHSRIGSFALLLACGLLVFLVSMTFAPKIPRTPQIGARMGLCLVFAGCAFFANKSEKLRRYWQVFAAFGMASFSLLLAWMFSDLPFRWLPWGLTTPQGIASAKVSEALLVVIPLLVMNKVLRGDLASIYIQKGKLKMGLLVGGAFFAALTALAVWQTKAQGLGVDRIFRWTPWILAFVLANAFEEELLFRGLFLKEYDALVGSRLAILITALIFAMAHMQVTYAPHLLGFLVVTFLLALAWGYLMQKTQALWASVLFHAGADMLIIVGIFASYGVKA
jgi:membrane protease YdiL (CAAX protease family)